MQMKHRMVPIRKKLSNLVKKEEPRSFLAFLSKQKKKNLSKNNQKRMKSKRCKERKQKSVQY